MYTPPLSTNPVSCCLQRVSIPNLEVGLKHEVDTERLFSLEYELFYKVSVLAPEENVRESSNFYLRRR